MKFNSAQEIFDYLMDGWDLYDPTAGIFLSLYNDYGSICYYYLSPDEYAQLCAEAEEEDEDSIMGLLGSGGSIYDPEIIDEDGDVVEYGDDRFEELYDEGYEPDYSYILEFLDRFVGDEFE